MRVPRIAILRRSSALEVAVNAAYIAATLSGLMVAKKVVKARLATSITAIYRHTAGVYARSPLQVCFQKVCSCCFVQTPDAIAGDWPSWPKPLRQVYAAPAGSLHFANPGSHQ
jgi:hypothetical protein